VAAGVDGVEDSLDESVFAAAGAESVDEFDSEAGAELLLA